MLLFNLAIWICAAALVLSLWRALASRNRTIRRLRLELSEQTKAQNDCRRQLELLFSANPYPMWTYDRKTLRFVSVNEAAIAAYGYSREEFLNMTLFDIRPEEDGPVFLAALTTPHEGYTRPGRYRHRRKDGSIIVVEILGLQFEAESRPLKMVAALDVTEGHRVEQALRESEARLKTLIDNAPFGIALSAIDGDRLIAVNSAMLQLLGGYSAEEVAELQVSEHLYADPKERDRIMQILRRTGKIQGWETNLRRRNGTLVPVRITGSTNCNSDRDKQVFASYIEDLTQQSKLEQQVRQVQKLEAVGRLAGGMAHDFNNILVVIKLSTEMLLSQITPEHPFSKSLLQINGAADKAAALTRQMLAFGRQQIMQPRVLNLNTVVSETTQMLRRVIGEDIHLVTSLAENVENSLLDSDQVTQVIMNLAVNARDAMPQGGSLHIETAMVDLDENYAREHPAVQPGRYVMLAVSDTGTGIDNSVLPRIFDPFFTTKEVGKGTGLGLSIVYGIVKQSGGYIWVYSELGHGTTFKLYFPASPAAVEFPQAHAVVNNKVSGQTLLVVEDEASIRSNLRECLQQLGYKVLEADNGVAALQVCEQIEGKVDLVITDLVMAKRGGDELASDLAERYPQIRVLFMSGYTEDTASRRDILLKGSPFLQKPFSVADLATAVHDALLLTPLSCD